MKAVAFLLALLTLLFAGLIHSDPVTQYEENEGHRYAVLKILDSGRLVRLFRGRDDDGGTFEKIEPPHFSEDHKYLLFSQVDSGEVIGPDDLPLYHEVAYCGIVNTRTGCLIARETGEFCGGSFTKEGGWDNPTYPDFDLEAQSPRAWDYAKGRSVPHGGTLASLENLLLCDPPDRENLDAYKAISEKTFSVRTPKHFVV